LSTRPPAAVTVCVALLAAASGSATVSETVPVVTTLRSEGSAWLSVTPDALSAADPGAPVLTADPLEFGPDAVHPTRRSAARTTTAPPNVRFMA
ncbi:MAG: hypothetical protein JWP70_1953, partial [Leifsonia sp.]|nr:hypothetical protein [Leifsonia sp.]